MKYIVFPLIIITFLLAYLIARSTSRYNRLAAKNQKNFWEREAEAGSVRRADISNLDYIHIVPDNLPLDEAKSAGCNTMIEQLISLSNRRIINLTGYTNTDLKLMYGPANLDALTEYDNNFTELIKLLNKLGEEILAAGDSASAGKFFEYAISIGSDISNTYVRLGEIYAASDSYTSLDALIETAKDLNSLSSSVIITKLNNIKSDAK